VYQIHKPYAPSYTDVASLDALNNLTSQYSKALAVHEQLTSLPREAKSARTWLDTVKVDNGDHHQQYGGFQRHVDDASDAVESIQRFADNILNSIEHHLVGVSEYLNSLLESILLSPSLNQ